MTEYRFVLWHDALHMAKIVNQGEGAVAMTPGTVTPFAVGNPKLQLLDAIPLACADTAFDMVALARRGLQALLDEAVTEVKLARAHEVWDRRTGQLAPESEEAKATAWANWCEAARTLDLFNVLHPEPVAV